MEEILNYFTKVTGFDFSGLVAFFNRFSQEDYPLLSDLYAGRDLAHHDGLAKAFRNLKECQVQVTAAKALLLASRNAFTTTAHWEGLELLEDMEHALQTIANLGKWNRSSTVDGKYRAATSARVTLKQNHTLEDVQGSIFGPDGRQNDWATLALDNDLTEEQYSPEGGTALTLRLPGGNTRLNSVVDYLQGERLYGLDFARTLRFVDDDLHVLDYQGTIAQAAEILLNLKRGDLPQAPNKGTDVRLYRGTTAGAISYPALFRQIFETFQSDDTFASITLRDVEIRQDGLFIEMEIQTKLGEVLTQSAVL
jgi:hypothetical protein